MRVPLVPSSYRAIIKATFGWVGLSYPCWAWFSDCFGVDRSGPSAEASLGSTEQVVSVLNSILHLCLPKFDSLPFRLWLLVMPQGPLIVGAPVTLPLMFRYGFPKCMRLHAFFANPYPAAAALPRSKGPRNCDYSSPFTDLHFWSACSRCPWQWLTWQPPRRVEESEPVEIWGQRFTALASQRITTTTTTKTYRLIIRLSA